MRRVQFYRKKAPMQISKSFLVVSAVASCAALLALRAADSDTDLKLRQALEKKLNELQSQPPATTPQPAAAAPALQTPTGTAAAAAPVAAPTTADSETIAKVREALRRKMAELQATSGGGLTLPPTAQPGAPTPADPETIAKLRAALRQKMSELDSQGALTVASSAADSESMAKMREALRQKMKDLQAQPPGVVPTLTPGPAVAPAPRPAVQPPSVVTQPAPALAMPPAADSESIAKMREALRQKMKELEAQSPVPALAPVVAKPKPAEKPAAVVEKPTPVEKPAARPQPPASKPEANPPAVPKVAKKPAKGEQLLTPIQGPATAVSADKQQRLAELLRKYIADEITPEEYHRERAKIVNGP